jgi:LmbE family N-acetylglucosaminyl deacetylase
MTAPPPFCADDRLLVFAPHPDDETLATGELIQSARSAGAAVRVVFATDGDNNPWPQRWLERRWRIGAEERQRWGARRRREATAALAVLGIDACDSIRFLGWPDQGLTDALMHGDRAVDELVDVLSSFAPTHLAMPTLADRHPDHSALRVMLELALLRADVECMHLGYVVHRAVGEGMDQSVEPERQQRKQAAMQAYASQMSLSAGRLRELASRRETFDVGVPVGTGSAEQVRTLRIPRVHDGVLPRRHEFLLIAASKSQTLRWRVALPAQSAAEVEARAPAVTIERTADAWLVSLPSSGMAAAVVFAKIHRTQPRVMIFDRQRWNDTADLLRDDSLSSIAAVAADPA